MSNKNHNFFLLIVFLLSAPLFAMEQKEDMNPYSPSAHMLSTADAALTEIKNIVTQHNKAPYCKETSNWMREFLSLFIDEKEESKSTTYADLLACALRTPELSEYTSFLFDRMKYSGKYSIFSTNIKILSVIDRVLDLPHIQTELENYYLQNKYNLSNYRYIHEDGSFNIDSFAQHIPWPTH